MHGDFLRLLFLQAHREIEAYFAFSGTPAQPDQDQFRFRRVTFYSEFRRPSNLQPLDLQVPTATFLAAASWNTLAAVGNVTSGMCNVSKRR